MWESRAIESLFICPDLLYAVAVTVQSPISLDTIKAEVEALAEDQKSRVRKDWLNTRVISEVPSKSGKHESTEVNFDAQAELFRSRAEYLKEKEVVLTEEFEELWRQDKVRLVKPKEVFQRLKKSNPFSSKETLRDNLITQLLRDESRWPDDLLLLRDKLNGVIGD